MEKEIILIKKDFLIIVIKNLEETSRDVGI